MTTIRRLAAILAADVAGYSRLIGSDEAGTLARLRAIRVEVIDPAIAAHNGRLVKTTGDGLLVEFSSVVDALHAATEIQTGMAEQNAAMPQDERIEFRMGLNVGDVVVEDGDIFGDGVNVAARLEGLAEPGGICVSARVQEDVAGRLDLAFEDMGEQQLKNIARPVRAYRVRDSAAPRTQPPPPSPQVLPLPDKPSIAVLPFVNMSSDPGNRSFRRVSRTPFRDAQRKRWNRRLGDHGGLKNYGVNFVRVEPGGQSSARHSHTKQDEFVYIIEGEFVLVTDAGRETVGPGTCIAFPAGTGDGHHFLNGTDNDAAFLVVGDRTSGDEVTYPDIDLELKAGPDGVKKFRHKDGSPYPKIERT